MQHNRRQSSEDECVCVCGGRQRETGATEELEVGGVGKAGWSNADQMLRTGGKPCLDISILEPPRDIK